MGRTIPDRRGTRRHRALHRAPAGHAVTGADRPPRLSDFVLALLGVVLLGGLALAAAFALTAGPAAP